MAEGPHDGRCVWDRRCSCPAKPGRREVNGCDNCPYDKIFNRPDNEKLMMYDVPKSWQTALRRIRELPQIDR